jgi:hypothetical protein
MIGLLRRYSDSEMKLGTGSKTFYVRAEMVTDCWSAPMRFTQIRAVGGPSLHQVWSGASGLLIDAWFDWLKNQS